MFNTKKAKVARRKPEPEPLPAPAPPGEFKPSPQQEAVFGWVKRPTGHGLVRARAGTGKTTTILKGAEFFRPTAKVLLCAFNKSIADELSKRCYDYKNVRVSTLHALGYSLLKKVERRDVDNRRGYALAKMALKQAGKPEYREWVTAIKTTAEKVKEIRPINASTEEVRFLAQRFDTFEQVKPADEEWVAQAVLAAVELAVTTNDGLVDYSDMLFLPLRQDHRPDFDTVMVDEAQDMNEAQLLLAQKVVKPGGRILLVGDDRQGIYGFRGASTDALDRLKGQLSAEEMPLTVTYRCPKQVVELAKIFVPDFEAGATAPQGVVRELNARLVTEVQSGDFILSRVNAPLLRLTFDLIACGKRAYIRGRDVATKLLNLIDKLVGQSDGPAEHLLTRLHDWYQHQLSVAQGDEDKQADVTDTFSCLEMLCQQYRSVSEVTGALKQMFSDDTGKEAVCLSTVHRIKGLEAKRVFILAATWRDGFELKPGTDEEANLKYVAVTRAKEELIWVR